MPVYFIRQGVAGPVKIGVANDAVKRLRQLQTNQPIPLKIIRLLEGDRAEEAKLHTRFAAQRLNGEWFSYSADMSAADLGVADLPIPFVKRSYGRGYPENAWGREHCLHREILTAIGGPEALGRRMRQPPWEVVPGNISPRYWSAVAMMLIEVGRHDITLDMLFEAQTARLAEAKTIEERNAKIEASRLSAERLRKERDWVAMHGPAAAWWPLTEPEETTASEEAA